MTTIADRPPLTAVLIVAATLILAAGSARADVWLAPGDVHARNAAQYLADQPGASGLSTEWPMWAPSSTGGEVETGFASGLRDWMATREQRAKYRIELRGASDTPLVRTFGDEPRSHGEIGIRTRYGGGKCGALLSLRIAVATTEPGDRQHLRPDGTVVGCRLGNWRLTAGWEDRWWGVGWNGSLGLGTNARPVPGFAITRDEPRASSLPVIKWLGEWRASAFVTRMENGRGDIDHPLFLGARFSFRPNRSIEFGAQRTVQMCGRGRPCSLSTFADMLIGNDNRGINVEAGQEPGNQMGGFDLRLVSPWKKVPIALYAQEIGEDSSSFLPAKYLGIVGAETWHPLPNGALLRIAAEYADTACRWNHSLPRFDCAYTQTVYNVDGYRYRGRSMGHGYDNDAAVWSGILLYTNPRGTSWQLVAHAGRLNRGGLAFEPRNTVSPVRARYRAARAEATGRFGSIQWNAGVGYEKVTPRINNNRDEFRVYAGFSRDFRL